jgi:hypothetical protein
MYIMKYISCLLANFRLSQLLTVDVNSGLRWLHPVYVGDVAIVLEVHGSSIFRVEACRVGEFLCMQRVTWPCLEASLKIVL